MKPAACAHAALSFAVRQQRIELAGALERIQLVAAADMGRADEDLRHGDAAVARARSSCARRSGSPLTSISVKCDALAGQQRLGRNGNRDSSGWCRFRLGHVVLVRSDCLSLDFIWECAPPSTTRANTSTSTLRGAGAQQRPRAGIDGRAGGQHVVDQDEPPAGDLGLAVRRARGRRPARWRRARPATARPAAASP